MKTSEEISKKTNGLIEKNNDAYKGFKKAAENAESSNLKSYLIEQAGVRRDFAAELSDALKSFNPEFDPDTDGSITGSLHRTWIDIKTALSGDEDESILEECIRGDKASVDEYEEFLENYSIASQEIASTIQKQLQKIRTTLDRVSRLEDLK